MQVQHEEIERQQKHFQFEIKILGDRIRDLEIEKEGLA